MSGDIIHDDGALGRRRLADAGAEVGAGVRAWLTDDVEIGSNVRIADGAVIVADRLRLADDVSIGAGANVRSALVDIGANSEVLAGVSIVVADEFVIGRASRIEADVSITCRTFRAGRLFYFGHNSSVGYGGTTASTSHVTIGHRVALGPYSILNANMPIQLGDQVGSGCNLAIWTHGFHFGHRLTDGYDAVFRGVHIEENVWLGFHVTVLPGVAVGANTIIAAGAVVSRDLPADVLAGGVPAKVLRPLSVLAVTDEVMWTRIEGLLDDWCEELDWKGVAHGRPSPREVIVGACRIVALTDSELLPVRGTESGLVVISLGARPELRGSTGRDLVLFELRSGGLRGELSPTAHDLRDHLRRHALPCGDLDTFRSFPSEPFARLLAPGRE